MLYTFITHHWWVWSLANSNCVWQYNLHFSVFVLHCIRFLLVESTILIVDYCRYNIMWEYLHVLHKIPLHQLISTTDDIAYVQKFKQDKTHHKRLLIIAAVESTCWSKSQVLLPYVNCCHWQIGCGKLKVWT